MIERTTTVHSFSLSLSPILAYSRTTQTCGRSTIGAIPFTVCISLPGTQPDKRSVEYHKCYIYLTQKLIKLAEDFVRNSEESYLGNCRSRRMAVAQHFSLSALKNAQATSHLLSLSKLQTVIMSACIYCII